MFEELPLMIGFAIFSVIVSYLLLSIEMKLFSTIIRGFAVIGIAIHELFHIGTCVIICTPIREVKLLEKSKAKKGLFNFLYNGRVSLKYPDQLSFLQCVLIGFAPVYLSFWLFFFLLYQLNNFQLPDLVASFYVILMISLSISATLSVADSISVVMSFGLNLSYTFYHLSLLGLSMGTIWFLFTNFHPAIFQEILLYLLIELVYFVYKYEFKLIKVILIWIITKKVNLKNRHRETPKPESPFLRKIKQYKSKIVLIKEVDW